jgi:hypothetical protein
LAGSCVVLSLDEEELELAAGAAGVVEPLALVEPPDAESCFGASVDEEELADDEGGVAGAVFTDAEPETELPEEGELGVVEPADEDDDEPGVVVVRETARSPSLSQPVRIPAPSARETATASVVSFIKGLRGLG